MEAAEHLARNFYLEKESIIKSLFTESLSPTMAKELFDKLDLNHDQKLVFREFVSTLLTDTMYTILLGLDGSASIGDGPQETYTIFDEQGNKVSECGELEAEAYEYFHENKLAEE